MPEVRARRQLVHSDNETAKVITSDTLKPHLVDVSGQTKPVIGLPDGVLKYRCRFRVHSAPVIYLRFSDRVQKHILLISGESLEPFEKPEAVNVIQAT